MKPFLAMLVCAFLVSVVAAQQEEPLQRLTIPPPIVRAEKVEKVNPYAAKVARLHYGGGGDWYWGRSAVPNLLTFIKEQTGWPIDM